MIVVPWGLMVGGWANKTQLVRCFPQTHPDYYNQPTITPPVGAYTHIVSAYSLQKPQPFLDAVTDQFYKSIY